MPGSLAAWRGRLAEWAEQATGPSRVRNGAALFMFGSSSPLDRVVASGYYALLAGRWGRYADDPLHRAPFAAGLEHCRPPRRVLDIGTGGGASAALAAERFPDAAVVAVDVSRRMLAEARQRHRAPNLEFRHASATSLPWPAGTFDLAVCLNSVPELVELCRVTTRDAQVLTATSTLPLRGDGTAWVGRWREMGFRREAAGEAGRGSWELYERDEEPAASV